jgi:3,4-dihydroxy 2-butanone 4-phosphate synthase/GTP cyclohydrolase II
MNEDISLNSVEEAVKDLSEGKVVIVVDDEDRENEGDFICAAEAVTPEIINFMATHGRGLICTPILEEKAMSLGLELMVNTNTALHHTAFTVSIDLIGDGVTTGISASDRAKTIQRLASGDCRPEEFARPGHVFPLISKSGGVLRRTGHTEAATDLAVLAGFSPVGVLVEILREDGSMARLPDLFDIACAHDLKIISIEDLVSYRMAHESIVREVYSTTFETAFGEMKVAAFEQVNSEEIHIAVVKGKITAADPTLVRVHSAIAGESIYYSLTAEGLPVTRALQVLQQHENGIVLIMRHEEKNDELLNRLKRLDGKRVESKTTSEIQRDFGVGAQILRKLGVRKIKLLSNSPKRRIAIEGYGLEILEYVNY